MNMKVLLPAIAIILLSYVNTFSSYEIANSKYLKGDINGTLSEITKDLTSGIKDSRIYYLAIKIHKENLKDYYKAIDYAIEAVKLFPQERKKFSTELGELYFLSGKYDKSLAILLNLNSEYPGDPDILYLIGLNYYYTSRYYKSMVAFEASRYSGNKRLDLYEFLGESYSKVGKYRESLELLSYVYNSTGRKDILAQIVEIANILDVSYSDYIVKKSQPILFQPSQSQQMKKPTLSQASTQSTSSSSSSKEEGTSTSVPENIPDSQSQSQSEEPSVQESQQDANN